MCVPVSVFVCHRMSVRVFTYVSVSACVCCRGEGAGRVVRHMAEMGVSTTKYTLNTADVF